MPFNDGTSGAETYGAKLYLLNSINGADLGIVHEKLMLDFNFSYHPSCRHSSVWVYPLAPIKNTMPAEVNAS
ncbi:MAG: DUF1684 domain-containing protein, partial [Alphaproteobacteria bacterium]|nr:DUF1684 domain-containing protein [Alphaproteobacteria bacterium]